MSRVEILGQFNIDYPCVARIRGEVQIDPSSALPTVPSNWSAFKESDNRILSPLTTLRLYSKILSTIMYLILFTLIIVFILLPNVLNDDSSFRISETYNFVPFVAFVIIFIYLWIQMRVRLTNNMKELAVVCDQYSDNEHVKYELQTEHWGGCNKPHVTRYFILVHFPSMDHYNDDDVEAPVSSSMVAHPSNTLIYGNSQHQEQQQEQDPNPFNDDVLLQSNPTTTTTMATTSLFDQLKSNNL